MFLDGLVRLGVESSLMPPPLYLFLCTNAVDGWEICRGKVDWCGCFDNGLVLAICVQEALSLLNINGDFPLFCRTEFPDKGLRTGDAE